MGITGTKLEKAFKALRSRGYLARANFSCCSSCAGAEIANRLEAKIQKAKDAGKTAKLPEGAVYYHQQDNDAVKSYFNEESRNARRGRVGEQTLCLRYGPVDTTKFGEIGKPTVAVGEDLQAALTEAGIPSDWNGSGDSCIIVKVSEAFAPA